MKYLKLERFLTFPSRSRELEDATETNLLLFLFLMRIKDAWRRKTAKSSGIFSQRPQTNIPDIVMNSRAIAENNFVTHLHKFPSREVRYEWSCTNSFFFFSYLPENPSRYYRRGRKEKQYFASKVILSPLVYSFAVRHCYPRLSIHRDRLTLQRCWPCYSLWPLTGSRC